MNAEKGKVVWRPFKTVWFLGHGLVAVVWAPLVFSWDAVCVSAGFTVLTLCCGHSVGMHRLLIHRSFRCPRWLEYCLVHLGTLVGMGGPFAMLYLHNIRDWAQQQEASHDFFGHRRAWWVDAWWQLGCFIELKDPPVLDVEQSLAEDPVHRFMDRYWVFQQLPWAALLFAGGGVSWLVWGVSVRIFVSLLGHWLIGYLAHNRGEQTWRVNGASVQGYNLLGCGLITMGEGWHNNHHAFPGSARLGFKEQADPGWWFVRGLQALGLVWSVKTPEDFKNRAGLLSEKP